MSAMSEPLEAPPPPPISVVPKKARQRSADARAQLDPKVALAKVKGSSKAIRPRLVTAITGGGLLTIFFQALGEDYGVTVGQATQKFLILLAAAVFGYAHVDHTDAP